MKLKEDRCDIYEVSKMSSEHKEQTHTERINDSVGEFVVRFDLQNVFALPLSNVSNFFYKCKLDVYHLTAHCSATKQCYGVLWHETKWTQWK